MAEGKPDNHNVNINVSHEYAKKSASNGKEDDKKKRDSSSKRDGMAKEESIETSPVLTPKCIVLFRRNENYNGKYGIDWLRDHGDIGYNKKEATIYNKKKNVSDYKKGSVPYALSDYKKIVGRIDIEDEKDKNGNVVLNKKGKPKKVSVFKVDKDKYKSLVNAEYNSKHNFRVSWKKDEEDKPYTYRVPYLSLLPERDALLDLIIEINEPPKSLTFDYDSDYFELIKPEGGKITDIKGKGKPYQLTSYLKIKCIKEISINDKEKKGEKEEPIREGKLITVYADDNKDLICGKIVVVPNVMPGKKREKYTMKITFVRVFIDATDALDMERIRFDNLKKELKNNGFNQALIECEFTPEIHWLDLTGDKDKGAKKIVLKGDKKPEKKGVQGIHKFIGIKKGRKCFVDSGYIDHLIKAYKKKRKEMKVPPIEKNELIYFYLSIPSWSDNLGDFPGGEARLRSGLCMMFPSTHDHKQSHLHEGGHAFGISHSFDSGSKHIFSKHDTENIMDYRSDKKHKVANVNHFWRWQWYVMQKSLKGGFQR